MLRCLLSILKRSFTKKLKPDKKNTKRCFYPWSPQMSASHNQLIELCSIYVSDIYNKELIRFCSVLYSYENERMDRFLEADLKTKNRQSGQHINTVCLQGIFITLFIIVIQILIEIPRIGNINNLNIRFPVTGQITKP